MRSLTTLDLVVLVGYLVGVVAVGLVLSRRASGSMETFFVGGRSMPWWLLGVSMAATNFSIDTPVAITRFVTTEGISGVWFFWASAISALLVTFLFSRLWRRSRVLTDAEIIELRYGGDVAAALRLFKGFYFGVVFNAFIMGWVFLALIKVIGGLTDLDLPTLLVTATVLVFIYTLASGFYGVVATDFLQYFVALSGSVALAVYSVRRVGGLDALAEGLATRFPEKARFWPELSTAELGPLSVFLTYALVQWWAHKYSDGGGKHIQRMLSAKNEDHAFGASLFYACINYALQVWPWILTALASLLVLGPLADPETAYPRMMAEVLPSGLLGLVLAALVGAFMSTIDTHLNLGASYMVNDIYRRFVRPDAPERHYVVVSRWMMALLLALAVALALRMESVAGAWKFLLTFASGAGAVWIARWFWWRINAWSELSAMVASGVVASWVEWTQGDWLYSQKLGLTVAISTAIWIPVTLLTRPVDPAVLDRFVERVRPGSLGWSAVYQRTGLAPEPFLQRGLLRWALALVGLFGCNFALGHWLLARPGQAVPWLVAGVTAWILLAWWLRREGQRARKQAT